MPDIWTFNREKARDALSELGAECGVQPRVLKDRDPEWTCHINREHPNEAGVIGYDVYINDAADFFYSALAISFFIMVFGLGFLAGFVWRPRFKS